MLHKSFITSILLLLLFNSAHAESRNTNSDYVILLHGIARTSKHMKKLEKHLEKENFTVINIDYPSTKHSLEKLSDIIHNDISKNTEKGRTIHFVGYSMGGLLIRVVLSKYHYNNLGRVVQLAPPNQGSEVADKLKNNWLYKKVYGPAGQQLITDQKEIKHLLADIDYEVGIIAGSRSVDPISSLFMIKGRDDGKVSIEKTKLENAKSHIIVKASHTFFPSKKEVQKQTVHFLKNGKFERNLKSN